MVAGNSLVCLVQALLLYR